MGNCMSDPEVSDTKSRHSSARGLTEETQVIDELCMGMYLRELKHYRDSYGRTDYKALSRLRRQGCKGHHARQVLEGVNFVALQRDDIPLQRHKAPTDCVEH